MKIEVAYATKEKQLIVELEVEQGITIREAVKLSRLNVKFSGLDLETNPVGIFGKKVIKPETELIKEGDRYELYRPLLIDPKKARANRAEKSKADKAKIDKTK